MGTTTRRRDAPNRVIPFRPLVSTPGRWALTLCFCFALACTRGATPISPPSPPLDAGNRPPLDLHSAFEVQALPEDGRLYRARKVQAGALSLSSGTVAAFDPLSPLSTTPYGRRVPPARYPVELLELIDEQRFALARIVFAPGIPARWELAVTARQDARALRPGQLYAYGVDSGTGCFVDGAQTRLSTEDGVSDALLAALQLGSSAGQAHWPLQGDPVLIAFSSGYGDGVYASWWSLDAKGRPLELVTDFNVGEFARPSVPDDPPFRRVWARRQLARLVSDKDPDPYEVVGELIGLEEDAAEIVPEAVAQLRARQADPLAAPLWATLAQGLARQEAFQPQLTAWLAQAPADTLDRFVLNHRIRRMDAGFARAFAQAVSRPSAIPTWQKVNEIGSLEKGREPFAPWLRQLASGRGRDAEAAQRVLKRWNTPER
jgi:hypothetical protein